MTKPSPDRSDKSPPPTEEFAAGRENDTLMGNPKEHFGKFRLIRLLGQGGMGAVYLAEDTRLGRQVALKIPGVTSFDGDKLRARFYREARAAAALQHRNICPVYEFDECNGDLFMTMPYLRGKTLDQWMHAQGSVPPRRAWALVSRLAEALTYAHENGVVHRDLKPSNIMVRDDGEPIIMDFGIALLRDSTTSSRLTQNGEMLGTMAYMPPELLVGLPENAGPECDVYSLGLLLYEAITGKNPFSGGDLIQTADRVTKMMPPPPSSAASGRLPAEADHCILQALAKEPSARSTMGEFAAALNRVSFDDGEELTFMGVLPTGIKDERAPGLLIVGSSIVYWPDKEQTCVRVGRRKGMPGDEAANDLVVRTEGQTEMSLRISRGHFELVRRGPDFGVVDKSSAGTWLNGRRLTRGQFTPLRPGDCLDVARVVKFEVIEVPDSVTTVSPVANTEQFRFEAVTGQLVRQE